VLTVSASPEVVDAAPSIKLDSTVEGATQFLKATSAHCGVEWDGRCWVADTRRRAVGTVCLTAFKVFDDEGGAPSGLLLPIYWEDIDVAVVIDAPVPNLESGVELEQVCRFLRRMQKWLGKRERQLQAPSRHDAAGIRQPTFIEARRAAQALADGPKHCFTDPKTAFATTPC
jgi:hypothetical protein